MAVQHFETEAAVDIEFYTAAEAEAVADPAIGAITVVGICKRIPDVGEKLDRCLGQGAHHKAEEQGQDQDYLSHTSVFMPDIDPGSGRKFNGFLDLQFVNEC